MAFNFVWTRPYGHIVQNDAPTIRFAKTKCTLNKQALELLPEDTEFVDVGIDVDARVIAIRKSESTGRKLSKMAETGAQSFSCTRFLSQHPTVTARSYSVRGENDMILISF